MHRTTRSLRGRLAAVIGGLGSLLALLAHSATWAQTTYKIQPIVKQGDTVAGVTIRANADFEIGTLNDNGQIIFETEDANRDGSEVLIQYADGRFTPILVGGGDAPGGKWPHRAGAPSPGSMNQRGNVAFAVAELTEVLGPVPFGVFLWDAQAQTVSTVALQGMPALNSLTFEVGTANSYHVPSLNSTNEVALPASVRAAAGRVHDALFFLGRDGKLLPVALPDQDLPGGGKLVSASFPSLNDAGGIAFSARRQGDDGDSAYVWEKGTITPLAVVGTDAPGGGKFTGVAVRVNNKNPNVLVVEGFTDPPDPSRPGALYLFANGKLTPVLVAGQEMPGGGTFKNLQLSLYSVSFANDAGQHAILAQLEDGATAAYLMDVDGKLSLILKSGTTTDLGKVTNLGLGAGSSAGVGLNAKGQIALPAQIDGGPAMIVLLTPSGP
jgi:hypothetical protein